MAMLNNQRVCFTLFHQGFDFLYLTEADYQSLPSGAVIATLVPEVGYALEAVVGLGCRASVQQGGHPVTSGDHGKSMEKSGRSMENPWNISWTNMKNMRIREDQSEREHESGGKCS